MFYDGAWNALTGDLYQRTDVSITRGANSETAKSLSQSIQPGVIGFNLDNRSMKYSTGNPSSALWGKFRKGAPCRYTQGGVLRFTGNLASIRPGSDRSGLDLWVEVQAAGLLRRLRDGTDPIQSPPRVYLPAASPAPTAYWPLDDGPQSLFGTPVVSDAPFEYLGFTPQGWGGGVLAPWLAPGLQSRNVVALGDTPQFVAALTPTTTCTRWDLHFVVHGRADYSVSMGSGTDPFGTDNWTLSMTPSIDSLSVSAPTGTSGGGGPIFYQHDGGFHHIAFRAVENFIGDANFFVFIDGVLVRTGNVTGSGASGPVLIAPLTARFSLNENDPTSSEGVSISHVAYWHNTGADLTTAVHVAYGRIGELVGNRINRLCAENGLGFALGGGSLADTPPCGPQPTGGLMEVLDATVAVDGGILREDRPDTRLIFLPRRALGTQTPTLALDYTINHHLGMELSPPDDDQAIRNDVTITRLFGPARRVEKTTGPLGTAPPTAGGVGRHTDSDTVNVAFDRQAADHASTRVHVGTWNEQRYPLVSLDLNTLPLAQRSAALSLDPGARVTISNPAKWLTPDQIDLLVIGIRERCNRYRWTLELICLPFGPYAGALVATARASSDGSTVTATATATAWIVTTPTGPPWITSVAFPAQFPFDLRCGGERVTCTAVTNATSPQTFTVARSINGVVKGHLGAPVELWTPAYAHL